MILGLTGRREPHDRRRPQDGDYQYSCSQRSYDIKTARQFAFAVCPKTIRALLPEYGKKFLKYFFKKPGEGGGIFIMDSYKPYCNTLTLSEQEKLMEMYAKAEGEEKEILKRILRKYGADKLEL